MSGASLRFEREGRVALVTIDRPKVLNALDRRTLDELDSVFAALAADGDVGVVILTGAGEKAFAAGADIAELAALGPAGALGHARFGQQVLDRIEGCGKPVIAAINGFALGGGCELAMACTLRVAAEGAVLGQPEVNLGLIPGFAGTQRLARLVGRARALELILTGDRIDAQQALAWGLVHRVVPRERLLEECRTLAGRLLEKAPLALAYAMAAVNRGADMAGEEAKLLEATYFGLCFATEDMREGTQAFLAKRKPQFTGR